MGCSGSSDKKPSRTVSGNKQPARAAAYVAREPPASTCHFCKKKIPEKEYNSHTVKCDEREVTCWNSWCREKVRQGDLEAHMEQCVKKQTAICAKCGKKLLMIDLQQHREACTPVQCAHCSERTIGRILKYCPVLLLGQRHSSIGDARGRASTSAEKSSPIAEVQSNVSRIQRLFRQSKVRVLLEDTIFRLVHKEMDLKREGFAIFKAHDKEAGALPSRSKSLLQTPQVAPAVDHYFPCKSGQQITTDHIRQMIVDFTNQTLLPYTAAWRVYTDTMNLLSSLPNVVRLTPPAGARLVNGRWHQGGKVIVVGDIHGQLADLLHIIKENGMPSESTFYIFNGDFVDRGPYGVEVSLLLFSLLLAFPKFVALNRGNHECDYMNEEYGFDVEMSTKYDRNMFRLIQRCFCALPLGTLVGSKVFVVHGGLPRRQGVTIADICHVQRFRQIPMPEHSQPEEDEIFQDMMWSDPYDSHGWQESDRGAGVQFGSDVTADFLQTNDLSLIIRSHEEFVKGYEEHHGGRLVTVFSASNYDGVDTNNGCFIVLAGDFSEPSYHTYQVYEDEFDSYSAGSEELGKTFAETPTSAVAKIGFGFGSIVRHRRRRIREEVLRVLRDRIYLRRHRLMAYFTKLDRTQKGSVWKIEWVETMRNVLNLDLPWFFLRRYIAQEDTTGRVHYAVFLNSFRSPVMNMWMPEWESTIVSAITGRSRNAKLLMRSIFHRESVSYNEFCSSMRSIDHSLSDASLFQLFLFFDDDGKGFITGEVVTREVDSVPDGVTRASWVDLDAMEQLQTVVIQCRLQLAPLFKVSAGEKFITEEVFMAGLEQLQRGIKKPLSTDMRQRLFKFIAGKTPELTFEAFLKCFCINDMVAARRVSCESICLDGPPPY